MQKNLNFDYGSISNIHSHVKVKSYGEYGACITKSTIFSRLRLSNWKYTLKRERKKFCLKSKRSCYYFKEFNTGVESSAFGFG